MKQECIEQTRDFIENVYREYLDMIKDEDVDYRTGVTSFRRELILALAKEEKRYDKKDQKKNDKKKDKDKKNKDDKKQRAYENDGKYKPPMKITSDEHSVKKFISDSTEGFRAILRDGKV